MGANPATDVSRTRAKARDKSAARLAILDAARRLRAGDNAETMTLAAVAAEAGFARATVYGYFKNKEDLFQALQAADLSAMADAMSGRPAPEEVLAEEAFAPFETPSADDTAAVEDVVPIGEATEETFSPFDALSAPEFAPAPEAAPVGEASLAEETFAPFEGLSAAEPAPAEEAETTGEALEGVGALWPESAPEDGADVAPFAANDAANEVAEQQASVEVVAPVAQDQKAEIYRILRRLTPNDPENSEGSAASMVRFDRRLRVVERAVGDLQGHQERSEKNTSTSVDTVAESLRGLNQRLEESERRQREAFAELRAGAREAARRLNNIEGVEHVAPDDHFAAPEETPVDAMTAAAPTEEPVMPEVAAEAGDITAEPETMEMKAARVTYLTTARNSARIAAEESAAPKTQRSWLYRVPKKYLMFVCAIMSVVVFIVGALVVQRASAIAARADTISPEVAQRAVAHQAAAKRLAAVSPLDELSAMATSGDARAQLIVGLNYLKGADGVTKNPVEAAQWIGRAAQRGLPMAQYWAGYIYQHGIGVSADPDAALRWYEAAADQGNAKAMYNLGVGYAEGWTGAKDAPEASRWFARAARLGFVDAQFNLAVLYERGQGVPPNLSDAYKWYAIAAKSGDTESKKRLDAIATQLDTDDLSAAQRAAITFQATPLVPSANNTPVVATKQG